MYHKDRSTGMGGGVLLYIHESLLATPVLSLNNVGFDDSVWCSLPLGGCGNMLIGLVYRSPNSSDINNDKLLHLLQGFSYMHPHTYLLLMGDIDWCNISVYGSGDSLTTKFFDIT